MPRPKLKTETVTFRVHPEVKRALLAAAKAERRSMANMLELIVLDWCERKSPTSGAGTTKRAKNK
jgi:hypothetical protein